MTVFETLRVSITRKEGYGSYNPPYNTDMAPNIELLFLLIYFNKFATLCGIVLIILIMEYWARPNVVPTTGNYTCTSRELWLQSEHIRSGKYQVTAAGGEVYTIRPSTNRLFVKPINDKGEVITHQMPNGEYLTGMICHIPDGIYSSLGGEGGRKNLWPVLDAGINDWEEESNLDATLDYVIFTPSGIRASQLKAYRKSAPWQHLTTVTHKEQKKLLEAEPTDKVDLLVSVDWARLLDDSSFQTEELRVRRIGDVLNVDDAEKHRSEYHVFSVTELDLEGMNGISRTDRVVWSIYEPTS